MRTMDEARAEVRARWDADYERALDREARRLVTQDRAQEHAVERDRRREAEGERQRAEMARKAERAWRRLYGRSIARELEPWAAYWLVDCEGRRFAFSDRGRAGAAAVLLDGFAVKVLGERGRRLRGSEPDDGTLGVHLGRLAPELEAVNPGREVLQAMTAERAEERRREQAATAERDVADRERRREEATFGVAVSDGD